MAPMCNGGREDVSASKFPLLDRRGRRERLSLIASGGVVDKVMLAQRSLLFGWLIYHPVCAIKERGRFLYGAATPPVQEGKFAGPTHRPLADFRRHAAKTILMLY
jgi:hypothetical protein